MKIKHPRGGHFGGHLRDLFIEALEAYLSWNEDEPEPTVVLEANYEFIGNPGAAERNAKRKDRILTISEVCGLLWNCTDILPGSEYRELRDNARWPDEGPVSQTYAAAARYLLREIERVNALPTSEVKHEELHTDNPDPDLAFV